MTPLKIAFVVAVAFPLAACNPQTLVHNVFDSVEAVLDAVQSGIGFGKAVVSKYCYRVSVDLTQVNSLATSVKVSCKAKNAVTKAAAAVSSICNNIDSVNPAKISTAIAIVKDAKAASRAALADGC